MNNVLMLLALASERFPAYKSYQGSTLWKLSWWPLVDLLANPDQSGK